MTPIGFLSQVMQKMSLTLLPKYQKMCNHNQVGGLMGLCMGFSLLSFIEVIYWVIFRTARNIQN